MSVYSQENAPLCSFKRLIRRFCSSKERLGLIFKVFPDSTSIGILFEFFNTGIMCVSLTSVYSVRFSCSSLPRVMFRILETSFWMDLEEEEGVQPLLTIGKALTFKNEMEDDAINNLICEPTSVNKEFYQILNITLGKEE